MSLEYEKYPKSFLKKFTLSILKTVADKKFNLEGKEIIDADLIPEINSDFEEINKLHRKTLFYLEDITKQIELAEKRPQQIETIRVQNVKVPENNLPKKEVSEAEVLMKIQPMINDPAVQVIECNEEDKPLIVTRFGRKQPTQISLSKEEINKILEYFSNLSHIPLINGPFHVHADNLEIMAIYSEMTGSNFIITKENGR